MVCGFATLACRGCPMSFTARRSCTSRHFEVAFLTGKIGVMHFGVSISLSIPALSISSITGEIPSIASFGSGYCFRAMFGCGFASTRIGGRFFISPTSVGPLDHICLGNLLNSCNCESSNEQFKLVRHSGASRCVCGETGV